MNANQIHVSTEEFVSTTSTLSSAIAQEPDTQATFVTSTSTTARHNRARTDGVWMT